MDPYGILCKGDELTPEEKQEIAERPLQNPAIVYSFTPEQIKTRQEIGKFLTKKTYQDALQSNPNLAPAYLTHPPYLFYSGRKRLFGILETEDGVMRAHTVKAMIMLNNQTVGGTPLSDLQASDRWSQEDYDFITSGLVPTPAVFTDPLGFMFLV